MKSVLLSACAAIVLALGTSAALADDNRYYDDSGNSWQYQNQDFDYDYNNYDNNNYNNYGNGEYGYSHDIVSPRSIVRDLRYQGFSYISRPALAGRFYQVKARDPNGHKVKLYIDAYSGRIVKVKG